MTITSIDWDQRLKETRFVVDPYFVWADKTDYLGYFAQTPKEDDTVAFLVETCTPNPVFSTQFIALRDVSTKIFDPSVARWQFGQARTVFRDERIVTAKKERASVVAAVLDDGCALFNSAFEGGSSASTSIRWLWHQGRAPKVGASYWNTIGTVVGIRESYGTEVGPDEIAKVSTFLTEGERYRELNYLSEPGVVTGDVWKSRYHGASVLSQVSGNTSPDSRFGAPSAEVKDAAWPTIFVQFPSIEPFDTTGAWLGVRVYDGLLYVLDRAKRGFQLADGDDTRVPVVACISYGGLAGPHDGTSMLEQAIISLLESHKHLRVVLPAGNAFGRAIHAVAKSDPKAPANLQVFVPPDCPHPCFVEVWVPDGIDPSKILVDLQTPDSKQTVKLSGIGVEIGARGNCGIVLASQVAQGKSGTMILIAIQETRTSGFDGGWRGTAANAGVWKISICAPACVLHAWIERDDIAGRVPRAQQARFVGDPFDPNSAPGADARIDERSTFSSIANAFHERLYVVGSTYVLPPVVLNGVSPYSASGPSVANPARRGPDLSARSDLAPSLVGVMVDGVRSGDRYRSSGTSIAAGIAARYLLKKISAGEYVPPASPSSSPRLGTNVP